MRTITGPSRLAAADAPVRSIPAGPIFRAPRAWTILRLYRFEPLGVKAEGFFHLTANFNYPLMTVLSVLMAPSMVVRYIMGWYEMLLIERIVRIKAVPPDRVYGGSLIRPRLAVSDRGLARAVGASRRSPRVWRSKLQALTSSAATRAAAQRRLWTLAHLWTHTPRPQGACKTAQTAVSHSAHSLLFFQKKKERRTNTPTTVQICAVSGER